MKWEGGDGGGGWEMPICSTYLEATIASAAVRTSLGNSVRNPDTIDYNQIA